MSDTISMQIEIPADNDGFVLLQCPMCGEFFKLRPSDYEDDSVLEIHCPNCGLCGDNYVTNDVLDLAMTMAGNAVMELIHNEMKKWEKSFRTGPISFKAGKKPKREYEHPIHLTIEALEVKHYECCKKEAKIKPLLKICGHYCPFCGVKYFED